MQSPIRTASSLRPNMGKRQSQTQTEPRPSPSTPDRPFSYTGSPGSRYEDEQSVFELGSRHLHAGFSGERLPKCTIDFHPNSQRRVGDFRQWAPGYENDWRTRTRENKFGEDCSIWQMDLRNLDLALVDDKLERALREASVKYLLTDNKYRRVILALPSALPVPLLSVVLNRFFQSYQCPTISIFPSSVANTVAAGLRSALVIDIGWAESIVTPVAEFRETFCHRSSRAVRLLAQETGRFLWKHCRHASEWHEADDDGPEASEFQDEISFDEIEDIMMRGVWCRAREETAHSIQSSADMLTSSSLSQRFGSLTTSEERDAPTRPDRIFSIPLKSTAPPVTLRLPFDSLSIPTERAFFHRSPHPDDHELCLPDLAYTALLNLPLEIRSHCMSRIVITGGGSYIPGVKKRILDELSYLVQENGWEKVHGRAFAESRIKFKKFQSPRQQGAEPAERARDETVESNTQNSHGDVLKESDISANGLSRTPSPPTVPASDQPQERDIVEEILEREKSKTAKPAAQGEIRGVKTFGAFAGASILATSRVRGVATIEREKFLTQGLAGLVKEVEMGPKSVGNVITRRQTLDASSNSMLGAYWM